MRTHRKKRDIALKLLAGFSGLKDVPSDSERRIHERIKMLPTDSGVSVGGNDNAIGLTNRERVPVNVHRSDESGKFLPQGFDRAIYVAIE